MMKDKKGPGSADPWNGIRKRIANLKDGEALRLEPEDALWIGGNRDIPEDTVPEEDVYGDHT